MLPPRRLYALTLPGGSVFRLGERPLVMGVLNVTPDSFGDLRTRLDASGRPNLDAILDEARQMVADGADLIDIGGESTRPGAEPTPADEELARVVPVVERLAPRLRVPLSIDTSKSQVARAALAAGAAIVNDVTGLSGDPALADVVAESGAPVVLMHMRGTPKDMYAQATYDDVVREIVNELRQRVGLAVASGIPLSQIVVDPGIGFAKRPEHSYGVLARVSELAALDRPVLVGASRKSFLRVAIGDRRPVDRDWGTAAAVTAAVLGGAHLVRVHAVAEMVQVVRVAEAIRQAAGTLPG